MMGAKYTFGRISDASVLRLMDALIAAFNVGTATVDVINHDFTITKTKENGLVDEDSETFREALGEDTYLISRAIWEAGGNKVTFLRGKKVELNANRAEIWVHADSPFIDGLEVSTTAANTIAVLEAVNGCVAMAPPIVGGPGAGGPLDQSQAILNRVSSAISTLVEHTSERQKELDATRDELAERAEDKIRTAQDRMASEVAVIEENYASKEKLLEEREAGLDDRANTHVRREFAREMANLSDTRLSANLLSKSTRSFVVPISVATGAALLIALFLVREIQFISGFNASIAEIVRSDVIGETKKLALIDNINGQIMYAQIRLAIQSLGLAALVWFVLRQASSRYSLVSSWERELHKFRLDTERAGFLVEGDLEARKVNGEGLPDVLLESFSRNLFGASERRSADAGSEGLGDALSAVLGQAAKVRAGPDGVTVEVEGRGLKRAKRQIEQAD